jgi:hypothetical protein
VSRPPAPPEPDASLKEHVERFVALNERVRYLLSPPDDPKVKALTRELYGYDKPVTAEMWEAWRDLVVQTIRGMKVQAAPEALERGLLTQAEYDQIMEEELLTVEELRQREAYSDAAFDRWRKDIDHVEKRVLARYARLHAPARDLVAGLLARARQARPRERQGRRRSGPPSRDGPDPPPDEPPDDDVDDPAWPGRLS